MTTATFTNQPYRPGVVRLRVGRVVALIVLVMALVVGGGLWFLHSYGRKLTTTPAESTVSPTWMKQGITYPPDAQKTAQAIEAPPDRSAEILRQLAALQQQLAEQQAAIEALKRKPSTVINQQPAQAAKATPTQVQRPPGGMLFISRDVKEAPAGPKIPEYTLAPGATKLPCAIETAMNSDVPGFFTAKVTTNVYDTATGRHLLVPQGSTILGHDQAETLLYGSERMDTISLTLTLPDGRAVDLGKAPVTDQQGVAGLTGDVNHHYWRLFGAVFIGGALKGGMSAMNVALNSAAGAGQVATGIASVGNQAVNRAITPVINIRPTITVEAGQLCQVLLTKPLSLPSMWQGPAPFPTTAHTLGPSRR
jgi:type IV secretion system protein VirB10